MNSQKPQKLTQQNNKSSNDMKIEQPISKDRAKLNNFYNFKIDDKKLGAIKQRTFKSQKRVFLIGIGFGFFTEYLLGNTRIYQNIVRKATMRRLNAKKKQDDFKQQKYQRTLQKQKLNQNKTTQNKQLKAVTVI